MTPVHDIHRFDWSDAPDQVRARCKLSLLDLIGIAAAGTQTRLSKIIRLHAQTEFAGPIPMLFDNRTASASGTALAAGMTIDSLDGHDGFNPAKGHIGCPMFPAVLALGYPEQISGREFMTALLLGYEFGARAAMAQHGTCCDYHTSGSWGAVAAAAVGSRIAKLTYDETRHALGIAEYHGPRSQMMRCIDHPTMLKDGSGWGAMAGVSAVRLAQAGFTGAPAITVENAPEYWADFGTRWYMTEQYYKPYPVCRWAQAPIEAALHLRKTHKIKPSQITRIDIETFHESVRLATNRPQTTEEAQYSTSFPVAVALATGAVDPHDILDAGLHDPEILRLAGLVMMSEHNIANDAFPLRRYARVSITLTSGHRHESDWFEPKWDHTAPPTEQELRRKFHALADPILGVQRAHRIENAIERLEHSELSLLTNQILLPA